MVSCLCHAEPVCRRERRTPFLETFVERAVGPLKFDVMLARSMIAIDTCGGAGGPC